MINNSCLILFAKYPKYGCVKSRIAADTGTRVATGLYLNFLFDTLNCLDEVKSDLRICCYPPDDVDKFNGLLGPNRICLPQKGHNLGERMKGSFLDAFADGYDYVLVIGSDMPDLRPTVVNKALESLDTNDIVIGPALDGGYYLIGFRSRGFLPRMFDGIDWGSEHVFKDTMRIIKSSGRGSNSVYLLPYGNDIDTLPDLESFILKNRGKEHVAPNTFSFIRNTKLMKI